MNDQPVPGAKRVGDLLVDTGARSVARDGTPVELPKLSFDLLVALMEAAPDALSTEALMERVWAGRVVSAATIAKRVELLRQALGDDAADARYVALVRGYGYRLAVPVEPTERPGVPAATPARSGPEDAGDHPVSSRHGPALLYLAAAAVIAVTVLVFILPRKDAPPSPPERSIAVLPFEALGGNLEDQWFAEGLTEEVAHALARSGAFRVAGRGSTLAARDTEQDAESVGAALQVAHLLEGTVRREGGRVRIIVQLTSTTDGYQAWNEVFDISSESALDVHRRIAGRVAEWLQIDPGRPSLDSAASSGSPEAYAFYLQAVSLSPWPTGPDLDRAQALIERVTELDPGFAPGWNRLAAIHGRRLFFDPSYPLGRQEALDTIRAAVHRALAIDPTIGEAYANLAGLAWVFDRDLERAAGLVEQAVRLDPWNLEVLMAARDFARAIGDLEASLAFGAYILERDPLCVNCRTQYAGTLECLGDFEAAEYELRVVAQWNRAPAVDFALGTLGLMRGDLAAAERNFDTEEDPALRLAGRAMLQHARGDREAARRSLETLLENHPAYRIYQAGVAAWLGEKALALELLVRSAEGNYVFVQGSVCSPLLRSLHGEPGWRELMLALGRNADGSQAVSLDLPPLPGLEAKP